MNRISCCILILGLLLSSCQQDNPIVGIDDSDTAPNDNPNSTNLSDFFGENIDLQNLENYANQSRPDYIQKDNTRGNEITNAGATLGRVLFYDKNLSVNREISCASCHQQAFAFGDEAPASIGVDGTTGRHSMRLVNARFADESRFFWDERAINLETQTTMPIQDHIEMGFSGQNGDPDFNDLINNLEALAYYPILFEAAFGDGNINEARMQSALAQFIRSMQSFDSKYDTALSQANNLNQNFPTFSNQENRGKQLFMRAPNLDVQGIRTGGGLGCNGCHNAPEFDISPNSDNNGLIRSIGGDIDTDVTRSPSLRDLANQNGRLNGPMMHTGDFNSLSAMIEHYNSGVINNPNLDNRLRSGNQAQQLNMNQQEKDELVAFLQTLSGSDIYTNPKWSDPFLN